MTQNRRPAKQIIHHKLQKQCDENKSLGGILRYKDKHSHKHWGELNQKSIKTGVEWKGRQYLPALQMEGINSHPWWWCVRVCVSVCALNQPFKNLARNKALLVIQLGQWAIDRDFHNSVRLAIRLAGNWDHRSPVLSDRWAQPTRALSRATTHDPLNTHADAHTERHDRGHAGATSALACCHASRPPQTTEVPARNTFYFLNIYI